MSDKRPATRKEMLVIALIAGGAGLFFVLVGLGVVPPPGGKKALHAPLWVVFCAGLTFLLGGGALLLHLLSGAKPMDDDFPPDAPRWMRVVRYLAMVPIFVSFAAIGSWIAFGPGERAFSVSVPFGSGSAGDMVGRIAFGIGAIITWLCTIAVVVIGARKLRGTREGIIAMKNTRMLLAAAAATTLVAAPLRLWSKANETRFRNGSI